MHSGQGGRLAVLVATVGLATVGLVVAGCGGGAPKPGSAPPASIRAGASAGVTPTGEAPVPAESNPPGDIPDNQAYVVYHSTAGGFQVKAPEGWARADISNGVTFTDRLNSIQVTWQPATTPPSVERANSQDVPRLQQSQPAFQLTKVSTATLPAGPAVLIQAQENSPPNSVTGKQYRLEVLRYLLAHNGLEAVLLLSSPVGADNVDPWKLVSESFRWQ
jgi:hypothetical protein